MNLRTKTTHFIDYGDLESEIKKVFRDGYQPKRSYNVSVLKGIVKRHA